MDCDGNAPVGIATCGRLGSVNSGAVIICPEDVSVVIVSFVSVI